MSYYDWCARRTPQTEPSYSFDPAVSQHFSENAVYNQFLPVFTYDPETYEVVRQRTSYYPNDPKGYLLDTPQPKLSVRYNVPEESFVRQSHHVTHIVNSVSAEYDIVMTGKPLLILPPNDVRWYHAAIQLYMRAKFIGTLVLPKYPAADASGLVAADTPAADSPDASEDKGKAEEDVSTTSDTATEVSTATGAAVAKTAGDAEAAIGPKFQVFKRPTGSQQPGPTSLQQPAARTHKEYDWGDLPGYLEEGDNFYAWSTHDWSSIRKPEPPKETKKRTRRRARRAPGR